MAEGAGSDMSEGAALARSVERRIWRYGMAANVCAGLVATPLYLLTATFLFGDTGARAFTRILPIAWLYFGVVATIFETRRVRMTFRPVRAWLVEDRAPSASEWRSTMAQPRRQAIRIAPHWILIGSVGIWYLDATIHLAPSDWIRSVNSVVIVAVNACLFTFLVVERVMRPVLARAHELDPTLTPTGVGLSTRLALALVAIAGTPMAVLVNTLVGAPPEQVAQTSAVAIFVVAGGCLFAVATMYFIGRALTEPLQRLRQAQSEIEAGALDVALPVDEKGELGLVQTGFNQMVAGLRERERMRDVFGRHVGTDVARLAMERDFTHSGELCHATAMFVDIIGSTGLTQRKHPDEVVKILNTFFDAVVRVVGAEGGFINKFMGDGALCLFGAPTSSPDHAGRGLRAARTLRAELASFGDIGAAIGVASGDVVAGNVGAADRYEFTAVGDAVNEASRLCDAAKLTMSHVLASDRVVQAAPTEACNWQPGEELQLRGRSEPSLTYTIGT